MAHLEVILLERVENLGHIGEIVKVKPGFARNFLLPQKKALRASEANKKAFEVQKAQIVADNLKRKAEAEKVGEKLAGKSIVLIRQAGDAGQLYGSASTKDIAEAFGPEGFTLNKNQVVLDKPIKNLGIHAVRVVLHPEVTVSVKANIARSPEEAELQAKGVNVVDRQAEEERVEAEAARKEAEEARAAVMADAGPVEDDA
jgi:large subunit ribosomal protein L9